MKNVGAAALVLLVGLGAVHAAGDLYGTIRTSDGRELTGPMRWDKNENFWDDVLDASKIEQIEVEDDGFQLNLFGVDLIKVGGSDHQSRSGFSIPFGHLQAIERDGRHAARLTLKSGETIEVRAVADLGRGMRGVVIDDPKAGSQELSWNSIDRVEFRQNPGDGRDEERLYGTAESRGGTFEGYIVWDRDESMLEDVLDGYDDREEHEIPFREIRSTEVGQHPTSDVLRLADVDDLSRTVLEAVDARAFRSITSPREERVVTHGADRLQLSGRRAPPPSRYWMLDAGCWTCHGVARIAKPDPPPTRYVLCLHLQFSHTTGWVWEILNSQFSIFRYESEPNERAASRLLLRVPLGAALAACDVLAVPDHVEHPHPSVIGPRNSGLEIFGYR